MASGGTRIDRLYLSLGLDITEFDTDLTSAQTHVRQASAQLGRDLKLQNIRMNIQLAGMDNADSSVRGLTARLGHLQTQLTTQQNSVLLLNHAYQESVRLLGADATASRNLETRLANQQLAEARLAQQIRQTNQARTEKVKENISTGIQGSAMMLAPAVGLGVGALHLAVEAVESENLWRESMGKMTQEGNQFSHSLGTALGINEFELRKNVGMLNTMFESMGMGTQKSYEFSTGLSKLSYDMASFYNLNTEDAFNKIKSGITGEMEPLKALGILVDETTVKNYAYAHSIAIQGAELTNQEKITARYGVIMEATQRAQGDMLRTINDPANSMRVLKESVTQIGIEFGQTLIPTLQEFIKVGKGAVDTYNNLDDASKLATNSVAKSAVEMGGALTAIAGLGMVATFINPWVALATVIAVATKGLIDYHNATKNLKENNESNRLGFIPSETDAKVRLNPETGEFEKEVIKTVDVLGYKIPRLPIWLKLEGAELVEAQARRVIADIKQARKEQLESEYTNAGKPIDKVATTAINEKLQDEFDEEYSTKKWKDNFLREQDEARRKKQQEDQLNAEKLKANTDTIAEIRKMTDDEYENAILTIQNKVKELKKAKVDEVSITKWAEEAKKLAVNNAQKEYLANLESMRTAQVNNAMSIKQANSILQNMQAPAPKIIGSIGADDGSVTNNYAIQKQGLSLQTLENQQSAFNMQEKIANSARLQEKLSIIQQMINGEEVGSKRRKELLEQEIQTSTEYTKSLTDGIKSAMTEIENLQNKTMSAGSQAMSTLDKFFSKENNNKLLKQIAKDTEDAWNATSKHTMAQINQVMEQSASLEKQGIHLKVKVTKNDIEDSYKDSVAGIPESINQAKLSMVDFYNQIKNIGSQSTQQYFTEWKQNLNKLKTEFGGAFSNNDDSKFNLDKLTANTADLGNASAISFFSPWHNQVAILSNSLANIGGISGKDNTGNSGNSNKTINVASQNSFEFKGFTAEEINNAIERAKDTFGQELFSAIQDANSQYGV